MKEFGGKVAVITGAGSGIGRALALNLAARGSELALSDVDEVRVAETAAQCEKIGATARPYQLDVSDRAAVAAHAEQVRADFGRVNLVVNNAGVALVGTVEDSTWEQLDWIVGINFWGVVHGTKAFLPHLKESGDGYLVNISSVFGLIGVPTQSAYNATKFAVRGFTEALRQELLSDKRVGVSCVHPGGIKTNIVRDARVTDGKDRASMFDKIARTTPEQAARTILRGVQRKSPKILIGPDAYAIDLLPKVLGARYQRLVGVVSKRFL
ncbi:SDR family NAD(P)-dependent oxidoreductase [Amycolatopsis sp. CA-230715]|uniref:SDR family NAD(P)-dependent oxidoreductase n=1 Tax=Amycolatopsis sp. CA-230715 TaxID=2745196 RepID=UPI001C01193F|nr:SDR family NAD(P)-dependent oxidoreductase [Amycolatopsis sp. CA-230715]QWF78276.1 Putative oxidoreductase SadH [Amycolatopsis sp. CA-230715]